VVRKWERTELKSAHIANGRHPQFKPEPEAEHARATAFNFAAEYGRSKRKSVKTAETPSRQKAATNHSKLQLLSHFAEFPHDNLSVH
jgi:hypothetical protein